MRILLTGHKGFIGSHVYEHLTRIGYDVDGLDRPDDIGDFADVGCADYDIVIHLAAYSALRDSVKNPNKFSRMDLNAFCPLLCPFVRTCLF